MQLALILAIGTVLGLLSTLGIFFDRSAAGKIPVLLAGGIRGLLTALLVRSTVPALGALVVATGLGALYGALIAVMVVLAHGSGAGRHASYILLPAVVSGAVIGLVVHYTGR